MKLVSIYFAIRAIFPKIAVKNRKMSEKANFNFKKETKSSLYDNKRHALICEQK